MIGDRRYSLIIVEDMPGFSFDGSLCSSHDVQVHFPTITMKDVPELLEQTATVATITTMVVRNAMEEFHCTHLTDAQMRELNPIIRNAIATGLHAFHHYETSVVARRYVDYQFSMLPTY